jgi:hypothetical protein
MPQVFFNKRQSQINAGTDSRRSVKLPVFDKNWISFNFQVLVPLDQ